MPIADQKQFWWVKGLACLLVLLGLFSCFGSLSLWGQGFLFDFPKDISLASPMADFFINYPATLLAGFGLWRMKKFGYITAQFVAGFYLYASVEIFVDMFQGHIPKTPGIWVPQLLAVIVGLVLVFGLWPLRNEFSE